MSLHQFDQIEKGNWRLNAIQPATTDYIDVNFYGIGKALGI